MSTTCSSANQPTHPSILILDRFNNHGLRSSRCRDSTEDPFHVRFACLFLCPGCLPDHHHAHCRFNKEEEDFSSKVEYDDYLEEREDIIFNLVERIQVNEMEAKIAKYKQEHGESIARNEARKLQRVLEMGTKEENVEQQEEEEEEDGVPILDDSMMYLPEGEDLKKQTKEEWNRMALSSGWNQEMQRAKCIHIFSSSLHIIPAK